MDNNLSSLENQMRQKFLDDTNKAVDFCKHHEIRNWSIAFESARDMIEKNKMLEAADMARSVFGGMGSWNDMAFSGEAQDEYRKISDDLFASAEAVRNFYSKKS